MKIGIIVYDLSTLAGGTNLALTLGTELQKEGFEIAYACVYEDLERLSKKFGHDFKFKTYKVKRPLFGKKMLNYNSMLNHSLPVYNMCKEFRPDAVIEAGGLICSSLIPVLLKIPTIHYALETSYNYSQRNIQSRIYFAPLKAIEKSIAKRASICAISECTSKIAQKMWGVDATVIYPPVNTDIFKPGIKKVNVILCVLRFLSIYNFENMVEAFRKLNKSDYSLVIIGGLAKENESYYIHLKEITKDDASIKLLPNADFNELLQYYKKAKLFWYPTGAYYGIVIAEAQSAGLPAISFGRDSGPGEIIVEGKTGFLVDDFDIMAEKTKILLGDDVLLKKMSKAARENAVERFGMSVFRKKFKKSIEQIL